MLTITSNVGDLITRIQDQTAALAPASPHLKEALTRIGLYVTAIAKLNVRKKNLIDTGRLINSVRYEFFKEGNIDGILIGSFNVPYAAVHEFGYRGRQQVRSHTRGSSKVPSYSRSVNIPARPYLRPALASSQTFIIDTLRQALRFAQTGGNP